MIKVCQRVKVSNKTTTVFNGFEIQKTAEYHSAE